MDIRENAYLLCKSVWVSPVRDRARATISGLNRVKDGALSHSIDRGHFAYVARQQSAQFLGYLVVDQRPNELDPGLSAALTSEERDLLSACHKQMRDLNARCLAPLVDRLPAALSALDPYGGFPYELPAEVRCVELMPDSAMTCMAASFAGHPAIEAALSSAAARQGAVVPQEYGKAVWAFTQELLRAGPLEAPRFASLLRTHSRASKERVLVRHYCSLASVRASVAILDQLVYQAVLEQKLLCLGERHIIRVEMQTHMGGKGLRVVYQPAEAEDLPEPGNVVLVQIPAQPGVSLPVTVERLNVEVSRDFGETVEIAGREIDVNLNPYAPLLAHV